MIVTSPVPCFISSQHCRPLAALFDQRPLPLPSLWSLNRLSSDGPRRLMGVLAFKLPCGRCQL